MSESTALGSASPLPFGPSSNDDPSLKPNPHPYAIKTTHTAILSRTTSSGHITPSKHLYIPPTRTLSRSPTNRRHEYRGQRYSTGPTGAPPSPFPSPLDSPSPSPRGQPGYILSLRRPRADTLPTYFNASSGEPGNDLPLDPKTWTASQLSLYLTTALRVRSGEHVPERVARDIALWVRREGISGRTFLRWTDEDLKV
ncbi:hypothetical protein BGW80DRAFT_1177155 [Lactifluus volemus]|nr:hypothetical protein BGW80DRAFT_1177155 [Lactifluus volemus]